MMLLLAACNVGSDDTFPSDTASHSGAVDSDTAPDVPDLSAGAWATISGAPADALGNAVESAGDLNDDGQGDLLVAAYLGNRVCAVFGPVPAGESLLDALDPACFVGELDSDYAGYGMAVLGDVTGDGVQDIAVGSIGNSQAGSNAGKVYLLPGPFTPGSESLSTFASATWLGETESDYAGISMGATADLTGDGDGDLLIGASGYDGSGGGGGRLYLLEGPFSPGVGNLQQAYASITGLSTPTSEAEAAPPSQAAPPPHGAFGTGDFVGDSHEGGFDYDGDGHADLALGASGDATMGTNSGKLAVFFGPVATGVWLVNEADTTLLGEAEYNYAGSPIRGAPDLTGDGRDDLLVSADTLGAGVVYLASPALGQTTLETSVTRFEGEADGDLFGYAIATPFDMDQDGALDVAISATISYRGGQLTGAAWAFAGPFAPGVVSASTGSPFTGAIEGELFGSAIDMGGDLTGDGVGDVMIGARNSDFSAGFAGRVYLFGG